MHVSWTVPVESVWVFGLQMRPRNEILNLCFQLFPAMSLKLHQSNFAKSPSCVSPFALCLWSQRLTCFLSWQVYLINVTYSDNTSHIIYRRYSKFFDLQVIIHQSQTVSPLYTVQVGLLLKAFTCFPFVHSEPVNRHDCLYRLICKPGDFSLHLCLYSTPWHLYESVCGLVIDRGAGETWRVSVSLIELQLHAASLSLSLCGFSLSLPFLLPDLMFSSLTSSPLFLTLKMSGSWQAFSWNKQEN